MQGEAVPPHSGVRQRKGGGDEWSGGEAPRACTGAQSRRMRCLQLLALVLLMLVLVLLVLLVLLVRVVV